MDVPRRRFEPPAHDLDQFLVIGARKGGAFLDQFRLRAARFVNDRQALACSRGHGYEISFDSFGFQHAAQKVAAITTEKTRCERLLAERFQDFGDVDRFSGSAFESLSAVPFEQIVVTDTVPLRPGAPDNVVVISLATLLADSIMQIFTGGSVGRVFAGDNELF